jgi:hypothetical protein
MDRRVFLSASGAATIAGLTSLAGVPAQAVAPSSAASRLMAQALVVDGPPPDYAGQMLLYGQFVGAWTAHVTELFQGGQTYIADWHFGWILHRRGVQDVIRVHLARDDPGGTTVRVYDPVAGQWRVSWFGPSSEQFFHFSVDVVDGEIVQTSEFEPGVPMRWVFFDIEPDHFRWRFDLSPDSGQTWQTFVRMDVTRRL